MHESAVGPLGLRIFEYSQQAAAFDLLFHFGGESGTGDLGECGEKIKVGAEGIAFRSGGDAANWPAKKTGGTRATLIGRSFAPLQTSVEYLQARRATVVTTDVNNERVVGDAPFVELGEQFAEVGIDVFNHAKKLSRILVHAGFAEIVLVIFLGHDVWFVGGVWCNVGKKWLLRRALGIDPFCCLSKKQVGAVAGGFLEGAVVPECGIDVGVAGCITAGTRIGLSDAAAAVDIDFIKAAIFRAIGFFITEVPFAKDARGVARGVEHLRQRERFQTHSFAFEDGVGDTVLELMASAHQGGAAGRARWTHRKLRQQ